MAKPIKMTVQVYSLFSVNKSSQAKWGSATFQLPATLLIDWKPDWIACNSGGARPPKTSPTFIILHRTDAATPGSSLGKDSPCDSRALALSWL